VIPPTPVVEKIPFGVANPKAWVAWSTSPSVQPPSTGSRIDADPLHRREVDHQPAVVDAESGAVVPAAADGNEQLAVAAEIDGGNDVARVGAAGDERRTAVDHAVVDLPRLFVAR
jgi:hypothetical protein